MISATGLGILVLGAITLLLLVVYFVGEKMKIDKHEDPLFFTGDDPAADERKELERKAVAGAKKAVQDFGNVFKRLKDE